MSKRKPKASKHATHKTIANAQRANQAVVRSRKQGHRSAAAGSIQSPANLHEEVKQEARLIENPSTSLQDGHQPMIRRIGSDLSSATANMRAYQAMLQRIAQANMQFAFEFFHRLSTIKSPFEIPGLIAEFTNKQMAMFWTTVLSS